MGWSSFFDFDVIVASQLSPRGAQADPFDIFDSVNLIFGSRVMDPVTGIIMNDEMDDFSQKGVSDGISASCGTNVF